MVENIREPVLSIVLTTRNRALKLEELLLSLLPQTSEEVEIVVVDGASEDNTSAVLAEMKARGLPLNYHTLQVNGGMDRDFIRAADLARGSHIWFTGDDDIFNPGAVKVVLAEIKRSNPSLLVLNYEVADESLSKLIDANRLQIVRSEQRSCGELDEVFSRFGYAMSYIGSTVVASDVWRSFKSEAFIGSYFVHLGAAFTSPLTRGVFIVHIPAIRIRSGVASWQKSSFEIWNEKWPLLVSRLTSLSESYRSQFAEEWRRKEFRRLLWSKAIGAASDPELYAYFKRHPPETFETKVGRLMLRAPRAILVLAARLKLSMERFILKRNVSWALHELNQ